jgi:hypothetical protein
MQLLHQRKKIVGGGVTLLVLCLCTLVHFSCRKIDTSASEAQNESASITEKFFATPPNTAAITLKVIDEIKKRNQLSGFVANFANTIGYPVWDKVVAYESKKKDNNSTSFSNNNANAIYYDSVVLIPFVLPNSSTVNGYILAEVGNNIMLSYKLAKDYSYYPQSSATQTTATQFAYRMIMLNKLVFGISNYTITDHRLFSDDTLHKKIEKVTLAATGQTNVLNFVCYDVTVTGYICTTPTDPACINGCDKCGNQCYPLTSNEEYCDIEDDGTTGGGSSGPAGGNTGGSGNIPPNYPCIPGNTFSNNVNNTLPGGPLPPCPPPSGGTGWNPNIAAPYNPNNADPVIVSRKLRDSFPCIKNIIDSISSYANLNKQTQIALSSIFGINKYVHVTIDVNNQWDKDSTDADTKVDTTFTTTFPDGTDGLNFYSTIRLNPWVLKNSTKEYIASTIVHEALHAYINFKFKQYFNQIGGVDSNKLKQLFPIYWGVYNNSPYTNGGATTPSHNIMAANMIQAMATPLYGLTNTSMPATIKDSIYRSLAWGGLNNTTIWQSKPNKADIIAINKIARDTSLGAGHTYGPFTIPGFPNVYNFSSKSLNFKMPCQ